MLFYRIRDFYRGLKTIEQRSFWLHAPIAVLIAVVSFIISREMFSTGLYLVGAVVCLLFPIIMMVICKITENYHFCYTVFCIGFGAIIMPITFLGNGGFYSGMPIMCLACTVTSAFIYNRTWRLISFSVSIIADLIAFLCSSKGFGTIADVSPQYFSVDVTACFVMAAIGLFAFISVLLTEARHLSTNEEVLKKVMDESIRQEVIEKANKGILTEEGSHVRVSVLFMDISRFTSTAEKMSPDLAAQYLNTFLKAADKCIHENDGILDKFIGDCAMAYWIDPEKKGENILAAIRCVFQMRETLYKNAESIYEKFGTEMDFSAGIDYGDVVIGSIGSDTRKDFTIIGDPVNTANRLQGIASKGELLISDNVNDIVGKNIDSSLISEDFYLRGKNSPIKIYHVNKVSDTVYETRNVTITKFHEDKYLLHVCGCRGSFPVSGIRYSEFGGETSCYIIKKDKYALIIDCGSGLGNAKKILEGCTTIDILLTHVHYDHIIGLMNMSVFPRNAKLTMYGHFSGWCGVDTIHDFLDSPYWPINLQNVNYVDIMLGLDYKISEGINATFCRSDHPNNGTIIYLNVNGKRVCIFADLEDPSYIDPNIAYRCDLLLYDGMYDDEDQKLHEGWGHSTWQEGARYASSEEVRRLVITHHNPQNADHALLSREEGARKIFSRTVFARTGDIYII